MLRNFYILLFNVIDQPSCHIRIDFSNQCDTRAFLFQSFINFLYCLFKTAGAAGTAGVKKAVELGLIPAGSTVVSIVTGNGLKDVQSGIQAAGEPMRVSPDMDALLAAFAAQDIRP